MDQYLNKVQKIIKGICQIIKQGEARRLFILKARR